MKEIQDIDEKNFDFKDFVIRMSEEFGHDQEFLVQLFDIVGTTSMREQLNRNAERFYPGKSDKGPHNLLSQIVLSRRS